MVVTPFVPDFHALNGMMHGTLFESLEPRVKHRLVEEAVSGHVSPGFQDLSVLSLFQLSCPHLMDLHVFHVLHRIVHEVDGGDFVWRDVLADADAVLVAHIHLLAHISPQLEESQHHGNDDGCDIKMHLFHFFSLGPGV